MASKYYNWQKTLSYDALITMVISARGYGKTFGLRKQFINDFLRHEWRFVEITRYREELAPLMSNYFDRLSKLFPAYIFKTENSSAYIAKKPKKKSDKPTWQLCGYFVAMTQFQMIKKLTFNNVKRILLDECVLEKNDVHHRYLPNEWDVLTNIVDTVTRERIDDDLQARLYLLGNACDPINPYFAHAKLSGVPEYGFTWHCGKTMLLHYADTPEYAMEKMETLAGKMSCGVTNAIAVHNAFVAPQTDLLANKPKTAQYIYGFNFDNKNIGVWADLNSGLYYISKKVPSDLQNVYALTMDSAPNIVILKKTAPLCRQLQDAYRLRYLRFDTLDTCATFEAILRYCGFK